MKRIFLLPVIIAFQLSLPAQSNAKLLKSIFDSGLKAAKQEYKYGQFSLYTTNKDSSYLKSDTLIFTENSSYFKDSLIGYKRAHWTLFRKNELQVGYYNGYFDSASSFDVYRYKFSDKNNISTLTIKNNFGIKQVYWIYKIEKKNPGRGCTNLITLIKL